MCLTYEPAKSDMLWLETQLTFPKIYKEVFFSYTVNISIDEFSSQLCRRLRGVGLSVKAVKSNVLLINRKIYLWITNKTVQEEKPYLKEFMLEQKIARIGYILRLDEIPLWGCVQISSKHLINEENPTTEEEKS